MERHWVPKAAPGRPVSALRRQLTVGQSSAIISERVGGRTEWHNIVLPGMITNRGSAGPACPRNQSKQDARWFKYPYLECTRAHYARTIERRDLPCARDTRDYKPRVNTFGASVEQNIRGAETPIVAPISRKINDLPLVTVRMTHFLFRVGPNRFLYSFEHINH